MASRRAVFTLSTCLLLACGRGCERTGTTEAVKGVATEADARRDGDSAAPTEKAGIPARFLGTYALVEGSGEAGKPSVLELLEVTASGATGLRVLYTSPSDPITGVVFSPASDEVVFAMAHDAGTPAQAETIHALKIGGGAPRALARCDYQCALAGVGADGELWYVAMPYSLVGELMHVPIGGGPSVRWPHRFTSCSIGAAVSDDGSTLVLGVDDALGWPECIDGGFQGFYVVPVGDKARRDLLPKRIACFTTHAAKEINVQISAMELDGDDRIAFEVSDGWDADAAIDPTTPWSCKRDGTDPQRPKQLPPHVEQRRIDERDWLVIARAANETDGEVTRLAGPFPRVAAFARHGIR